MAALVAAVLVTAGALWLRHTVEQDAVAATRSEAERQVDTIAQLTQSGTQLGGDFGTLPYELVRSGGGVVSSSEVLKPYESNGSAVMPDPGRGGPQPLYRVWMHRFAETSGGGPLAGREVTAVEGTIEAADEPGLRYRVYVFLTSERADRAVGEVDPFLWAGIPLIVLLVAAGAGLAAARSLRDVEQIRTRTAEVSAGDPRERVVVPRSGDEVERLAETLNATLDRLETTARDHRRFVADAAHELRSPVATLRTGLEVGLAYPDQTDWPDRARSSLRSTERLQTLVDDLLLLAALDAGATGAGERGEPLVSEAGETVEAVVSAQAVRGLEVRVQVPDRAALVPVRVEHLRRLLDNLVRNAVRHASTRVQVDLRVEESRVVLDVADDGAGVPPADAEAIFERFRRLDEARDRDQGGSGLGLAISREIAQHAGGWLRLVDSEQGALFRCSLPLLDTTSPADAGTPES